MAATIGNFSSGDVLTAAEMNTLGVEYLGQYTFSGFGGVSMQGILADFNRVKIVWYGYLSSGTSGLYLRLLDGTTEMTSVYPYAGTAINMSTGSQFISYAPSNTYCRIGSIQTTGSTFFIDINKDTDGRFGIAWNGHYGTAETWTGASTFYNASFDPDGVKIYRTSNNATMRAEVYGYQ